MNLRFPLLADQDSAYLTQEDRDKKLEYEKKCSDLTPPSYVYRLVQSKDMEPTFSVLVPPGMILAGDLKGDKVRLQKKAIKLGETIDETDRAQWVVATTTVAPLKLRRRTGVAYNFRKQLEASYLDHAPIMGPLVQKSVMNKFRVKPSPRHCLGRVVKSYPDRVPKMGMVPITEWEATLGLRDNGLDVASMMYYNEIPGPRLFDGNPFLAEAQISINKKASAGLPFGGTLKCEGVLAAVIELAGNMYELIKGRLVGKGTEKLACLKGYKAVQHPRKVPNFFEVSHEMMQLSRQKKELCAIVMKAKDDMVSREKLVDGNRLINNIPAWKRMIAASAAQALDAHIENAYDAVLTHYMVRPPLRHTAHLKLQGTWQPTTSTWSKSWKGVKMMGKEPDLILRSISHVDLWPAKGKQGNDLFGYDFALNGDDSHIFMAIDQWVVIIELDVTNMDLSQHRNMNVNVHKQIYQALSLIDEVAGAVWLQDMREKIVVLEGAHAVEMKHGATSGISLISLANGAVMAVAIRRIMAHVSENYEAFTASRAFDADAYDTYDWRTEPDRANHLYDLITKAQLQKWVEDAVAFVAVQLQLTIKLDLLFMTDFRDTPYARVMSGWERASYSELIDSISRLDRDEKEFYFLAAAQQLKHETGSSFVYLGYEWGPNTPWGDLVGPTTAWVANHDMPRLLGGISYPSKAHYKDHQLGPMEAARLASTFMAVGRGNDDFIAKVITPTVPHILKILQDQIDAGHGDFVEDEAQQLVALSGQQALTLKGLHNFFSTGKYLELWPQPEVVPYFNRIQMLRSRPQPMSSPLEEGGDLLTVFPLPKWGEPAPVPTLSELATVTAGKHIASSGFHMLKALPVPVPFKKLSADNFGRRPPTRETEFIASLAGALKLMDDNAMIGPKKGPVRSVAQWKKLAKGTGGITFEEVESDDEGQHFGADTDEVGNPSRRNWADDYSSEASLEHRSDPDDHEYSDGEEERYRAQLEAEDYVNRKMTPEEQAQEEGNARMRAGY